MQNTPKPQTTQIEIALSLAREPLLPDIEHVFPVIEDWVAVADGAIPRIHGVAFYPKELPLPILSAAVIGIDTAPTLVIRCLDGCYRLGNPSSVDDKIATVGDDRRRGRIVWPRFQRLVDELRHQLDKAHEGVR